MWRPCLFCLNVSFIHSWETKRAPCKCSASHQYIFLFEKKKNQQQQPTHSYSHQLWHKICADINILQIFTLNKNKNKRNTSRLWTTTHSPLQVGWLYMPFHTPGRLFSFSRPTLPQPFLVITALISTRLSAWPGSHSCHSLQAVTKMFCMLC